MQLEAIALITLVDPVRHLAVVVGEVGLNGGTESMQVEGHVATDKRVAGPGDGAHPTLERPDPLVLLEGKPQASALAGRHHTGDVAVQALGGQQPHAGGHEGPALVVRAVDVAPDVLDRTEQVCGHWRLGAAPHLPQQFCRTIGLCGSPQLQHRHMGAPDGLVGGGQRRVPPCPHRSRRQRHETTVAGVQLCFFVLLEEGRDDT